MYVGKRNLPYLKENQIAGADTINPICDFLNGIRTTTGDWIEINLNANNSIDIDFNDDALSSLEAGSINSTFKAEIEDSNKVKCSAGKVHLPSEVVSISSKSATSCHSNYWLYVKLTRSGSISGSIQYSSTLPNLVVPYTSGNPESVNLPICQTIYENSTWSIRYAHIGDFILHTMPYFWIQDFDLTQYQSLDHNPNGGMVWRSYGECDSSSSGEEI